MTKTARGGNIATLILLFAVHAPCAGMGDQVEDIVSQIRARYAAIENANLRSLEISFESEDEPASGTCMKYFDGDSLVKIKLSYAIGDHGGSDEYFYYNGGTLFFAYASDSQWRFSGETLPNGEGGTIDIVTEHRAYFFQDAVIRHLYKEVQFKNPEELNALLSKTENKPSSDVERAAMLLKFGKGAARINTPSDLEQLLVSP